MRARIFITFGLALAVWPAVADETLSELKVGSNTYSNVTVTTVTATDIYFTHASGMGNAKLKQLSPELQKHFGYDATQAGVAEQKQATANAQYRLQAARQPAPRPPVDDDAAQSSFAAPASNGSWGTDLPAALNLARSGNKMVLLDFTGSDWCGWCMKFEQDVLSTDKFADYAREKLVLVKLDYPHHKEQDPALKKANEELAARFHVTGFPTFVLLNSAGREVGRQIGYLRGGPDAFIARLDEFGR